MKKALDIIGVTLLVASKKPLPLFAEAAEDFRDLFPGIFSIRRHPVGYQVEVSTLYLLTAAQTLVEVAEWHSATMAAPAPNVHPQPNQSK